MTRRITFTHDSHIKVQCSVLFILMIMIVIAFVTGIDRENDDGDDSE